MTNFTAAKASELSSNRSVDVNTGSKFKLKRMMRYSTLDEESPADDLDGKKLVSNVPYSSDSKFLQ